MHYEYETGNCDCVSYEYHCEEIEKRDKTINRLEIEIENLKQEIQEHKAVIAELKKLGEGILLDERKNTK